MGGEKVTTVSVVTLSKSNSCPPAAEPSCCATRLLKASSGPLVFCQRRSLWKIPANLQKRQIDAQVRGGDESLCGGEIGDKLKDARGSLLNRPLKDRSGFRHVRPCLVCMFCVFLH